jgi:hypothetical protein
MLGDLTGMKNKKVYFQQATFGFMSEEDMKAFAKEMLALAKKYESKTGAAFCHKGELPFALAGMFPWEKVSEMIATRATQVASEEEEKNGA